MIRNIPLFGGCGPAYPQNDIDTCLPRASAVFLITFCTCLEGEVFVGGHYLTRNTTYLDCATPRPTVTLTFVGTNGLAWQLKYTRHERKNDLHHLCDIIGKIGIRMGTRETASLFCDFVWGSYEQRSVTISRC